VKILCLGDPAQLPPVEGGGYFINAQPDHLLTEIHRSALDSPVTRLATSVRQSMPGDRTLGMPGMDGDSGRTLAVTRDQAGRLRPGPRRHQQNPLAGHPPAPRSLHGLTGTAPAAGGPDHRPGQLGRGGHLQRPAVHRPRRQGHAAGRRPVRMTVEDDAGTSRYLTAWTAGFTGIEGEKLAKREGRGTVAAMTFAQAITCHKSQGSQWDNVLVVDESWIFARPAAQDAHAGRSPVPTRPRPGTSGQRWLYTAITRAAAGRRHREPERTPGMSAYADSDAVCDGGIDWVVVGGESGPGARPMHPDWARSLRDQCVDDQRTAEMDTGIPFFFKQWGEWAPIQRPFDYVTNEDRVQIVSIVGEHLGRPWRGWKIQDRTRDAEPMRRYGKKAAGCELDGRTWEEFPVAPRGMASTERVTA
jgi:hypothetical protein